MRMYHGRDDTETKKLTLLLTRDEAFEMIKALEKLREKQNEHYHMSSADYRSEVTLCVYDPNKLDGLHEDVIRLIEK